MKLADLLFRIRSFTPIPFIAVALYWAQVRPAFIIIGLLLAILGELLRINSVRYAGGATRTRNVGASSLVTSGPYARVRNPLYVANMMIYTGFALASGTLFPYLPVVAFMYFYLQYYMIFKLEEKTRGELLGTEYTEYRRGVPGLFPKFISVNVGGKPNLRLTEALYNERSTLIGFTLVWLLLAVRLMVF